MKDWIEYIKQCVDTELWGFVLLDYFYAKKEEGEIEEPSQFIDRVLAELPKERIDPVIFHNSLLSVCVHLLGSSFDGIIEKSLKFVSDVKSHLDGQQVESIISHYDVYGKQDLFRARLKASKVQVKEATVEDEKKQKHILIDKTKSFDIGIVIALKEEFREFFGKLKTVETEKDPRSGDYYYLFEQPCEEHPPYRCVASFVGDKGGKKMTLLTSYILSRWDPKTIVILGIGAGIDKDVVVGDVVVGEQIDSYIEKSKAVPKRGSSGFSFKFGGEVYRATGDLIKLAKNFEFIRNDSFGGWNQVCSKELKNLLSRDEVEDLISKGIIREVPKLLEGNIASGPTVGGAAAFSEWIKGRDRNYYVLEMESGGALAAIYDLIDPSKSFVLRGVSDYGDERKKELENIREGALRKYAMHNAIELLWCLLEAGDIPRAVR